MLRLTSAATVLLLGTAGWAGEPDRLDHRPLVLDPAQLDRVAAGDRHDTPFSFVIVNNQRALQALNRGLIQIAPSATREHKLLPQQVGFLARD
jgi:hypothetical protein